tara:strand:+ start:110 stop:301 length:192 start_codon:yes stop_codon:yes gene_type:complete
MYNDYMTDEEYDYEVDVFGYIRGPLKKEKTQKIKGKKVKKNKEPKWLRDEMKAASRLARELGE